MLITLFTMINLISALLLVGVILLQRGDGGMGSAFGVSSAAEIQLSNNPLGRATTWLAIVFMASALILGWLIAHQNEPQSVIERIGADPVIEAELPAETEQPASLPVPE